MMFNLTAKIKNHLPALKYKKLSYSQTGEDLIIRFIFDAIGIAKPSFIDIGAHHPFYLNNTAILSKSGSKGINIEPDPYLFSQFKRYRKNDINLNIGVGDKNEMIDFYIMNVKTLNTFSKQEADKYKEEGNYFIEKTIKVPTKTIQTILDDLGIIDFPHFLNIDAEGVDELIMNTIDFDSSYPIVICIETISFSNKKRGVKNNDLINLLTSKGYILFADTYINSILVHSNFWK